jgi:hypothetical protein
MPSDRKVIAFRPDEDEEPMVKFIAAKYGVSMARAIGMAIRRMSEQDGYMPKPAEKKQEKEHNT